jgi:hypothetical protein
MRFNYSKENIMSKQRLSDCELWTCLDEADARKSDKTLSIDVRVRSAETYSICLREAHNRGYDYATLKAIAKQPELATA